MSRRSAKYASTGLRKPAPLWCAALAFKNSIEGAQHGRRQRCCKLMDHHYCWNKAADNLEAEEALKTMYEEEEFLPRLVESSAPFARFFEAECAQLTRPIRCAVIDDHHFGGAAAGSWDREQNAVKMRHRPGAADAHLIAHEIGHGVLFSRGFPQMDYWNPKPGDFSWAAALMSNLQDPLVEGMLARHGFNSRKKYKDRCAWLKNWYAKNGHTRDDNDVAYDNNALMLLKHRLWWQNIAGDAADVHLWKWLERSLPDVAAAVGAWAEMAKDHNYDTPEGMTRVLRHLVRDLGIETVVYVASRTKAGSLESRTNPPAG